MSAPPLLRAPSSRPDLDDRPVRSGASLRWIAPLGAGAGVLLAAAPLAAVLQGTSWIGRVGAAVAVVVALGIAMQRLPAAVVALGQLVGVLGLLTALFTDDGFLAVFPRPSAFGIFGSLLAEAGAQIDTGVAPVAPSAGALFLVTAAFGVITIAVYALSVAAGAPAAAGIALLCVVAVPVALTDTLLPWWTLASAAAGFGVILLARDDRDPLGRRRARHLPSGAAVLAVATVVALLAGGAVTVVGTAGRFGGAGSASGGTIGLNPFTSLRGQLTRSQPIELFRTTGLTQPSYLRALTLRDYQPNVGWVAGAPRPGVPVAGPLGSGVAGIAATEQVSVENIGFRDYWLPVYGVPDSITGVDAGQWAYDTSSGIAYSTRPREEAGWRQVVLLPGPRADELRAARGPVQVDAGYLDTAGVDPRIIALAEQVTAGAPTAFDKAIALVDWFTGPQSAFRYSLQTAPGTGDDALVDFLTVGRVGYCEQFSSAMAVMLRTVGVPARVAVGFTAGTDAGGYRSVGTQDAHAWVEAWFPRYGWLSFDPTPLTDGRTIVPPYVEEAQDGGSGGAVEPAPEQPAAPEPLPADPAGQAAPDNQPVEVPAPEPPADADAGPLPGPWVLAALGVLAAAALLAGPALLRMVLRRRRLTAAAAGGPGAADAAWAEILATSRDHGVPVSGSDTVRDAARRIFDAHGLGQACGDALRDVVRVVEDDWYGGRAAAPGSLASPLRTLLGGLDGVGSGWQRWRTRALPRSLADLLRRPRTNAPADQRSD